MSEDFLAWAGLTEERWTQLQQKLREWIRTEHTPARIMRAMIDDTNIGYREQLVLAYRLGRIQLAQELARSRSVCIQIPKAGLN